MRRSLGQPVVIENATGAEGSIGTGRVARAKLDGYTIGLGSVSTHALNGAFFSLQYDVLKDFEPIAPLGAFPYVLYARNTMPANDFRELITWLKANPNKASAGVPSGGLHLVTAFFEKQTGTQFTLVPYRGNPAQDLVAGQIDQAFNTPDQLPLMRAGSVKAYAVTSDTRSVLAPDLPALSFSAWTGLFAPKGTPQEIIGKLNTAAVEALADPAVRSRLIDLGLEIFPRQQQRPEALGAMVKADAEKWWPIIKEFGIKAQ
jgi:tripartite-type tricarboxylate transporter receptor subunit TctC